jgi:hypothetical protein
MIRKLLNPAFIVCLVVLAGSTVGINAAVSKLKLYLRKLPIEPERQTRSIPAETATWKQLGQDHLESHEIAKELGTDNTVSRVYVAKKPIAGGGKYAQQIVEVHLPYYTGMVDTVPHVSERCMTGNGWIINTGSKVVPVELDDSSWRRARNLPTGYKGPPTVSSARLPNDFSDSPGTEVHLPYDLVAANPEKDDLHNRTVPLRVTDFLEPGSKQVIYVGYFFIANNRLASSAEDVRLLAFDLRDDYAYYLKVQLSSPTAASEREFVALAQSILSEMLPEIMRCVPDWVDVDGKRAAGKASGAQERARTPGGG